MQKLSSDAQLDAQALQKIAAHGFATVLGTPATGKQPEEVKGATASFVKLARNRAERHNKLLEYFRNSLGKNRSQQGSGSWG